MYNHFGLLFHFPDNILPLMLVMNNVLLKLTFGLSIPMPNAVVHTNVDIDPLIHSDCNFFLITADNHP